MKAWGVMAEDWDFGVIVFAPTRGKAKQLALGSNGFECETWTGVSCKRIAYLDDRKASSGIADWLDDARLYYEAGWTPRHGALCCDLCGRFPFPDIPESRLMHLDSVQKDICKAYQDEWAGVPAMAREGAQ